ILTACKPKPRRFWPGLSPGWMPMANTTGSTAPADRSSREKAHAFTHSTAFVLYTGIERSKGGANPTMDELICPHCGKRMRYDNEHEKIMCRDCNYSPLEAKIEQIQA